jgi:hypothetical protein
MAAIYSLDGNEITVGLQGCNVCDEALQTAKRIADDRNECVELVDDDGRWLVHPAVWTGGEHGNPVRKHREDADFICELDASDEEYAAAMARLAAASE